MSSQTPFGAFTKQDEERKVGTPELTPPGTMPTLTSIYQCSTEFLNQLRFWFEQNPPTIPITNIPGFSQFTAQSATRIPGVGDTSSTAFGNLSDTAGPTISSLPDGRYVCLWGGNSTNSLGAYHGYMGVRANSTDPVDNDCVDFIGGTLGNGTGAVTVTLSNGGNNTVKVVYRVTNATASLQVTRRWMLVLRYANA